MIRALLIAAALTAAPLHAAPPPNDNLASATVMTGDFWLTRGTLHGSTSEPNEPILTYMPNGPTAWWQWTATTTGMVRVRTWGSERANMLAVYRGTSMDTLRLVDFASSYTGRANSADVSFTATAGVTYHLQVLGADFTDPFWIDPPFLPSRVQLSMEPSFSVTFVPANDDFAAAATLTGAGQILVCNSSADGEPGEPLGVPGAMSNTVWVSWTAPSSGVWALSSLETDFDNFIAVYSGSALNALTRIGYADFISGSDPAIGGGVVAFRATGGTTYRIQLMGNAIAGNEYGVCRLSVMPGTPPANDDFANALTLTGSAPAASGWGDFATREAGEPGSQGDESGSLWWNWTAPASSTLALISYAGEIEAWTGASVGSLTPLPFDQHSGQRPTLGGVTYFYTVTAGTAVRLRLTTGNGRGAFALRSLTTPANDDFANRAALSGATPSAAPDLSGASWETNEPDTDLFGPPSVWYRWTAPSTGRFVHSPLNLRGPARLDFYTGTTLDSLARVGPFSDDMGNLVNGSIAAVAGTEYAILVSPASFPAGVAPFTIRPAAPPVNDNFASATVMSGGAWTATGSNVDATAEMNEPGFWQQDTHPTSSVWWRWTAPASGRFRVSAAGSTVDSVLTVLTGAALASLTTVAVDQSAAWGSTGAVIFNAVPGTDYHIRVDGQGLDQGAIQLALQPAPAPPNDNFASRLVLSGVATSATGNLLGGTLEAGEANPSAPNGGRSVWFDWTAPASGVAFLRVTGERFSPSFAFYTGTSLATLSAAISGGSGLSSINPVNFITSYPVSSGTSYKIRIDGAPATNGSFQVSISMPAPPMNDAFASRIRLTGAVVRSVTNNEGATAQAGEPAHAGSAASHSVWHEWRAPVTGNVTLDTVGNTGRPRIAVYTGTALNALSPVASDAVTGAETFANVSFAAVAGVNYLIAADSNPGARGDVLLNLVSAPAVPSNDSFAAAATISTDAAEQIVEWRGASAEAGEPAHGGRPAARSLWWNWTPLTSRRATVWFETQDAAFLARIAVYRGASLGSLTQISALTSDTKWSRLEADVNAGETYRIVIDSPAVATIPGWIRWGIAPENGVADQAYLIAPEDGLIVTDTTGAFTTDLSFSPTGRRELWWAWTPEVCARMEWKACAAPGSGITLGVLPASSSLSFIGNVPGSPSTPVPGSGEVVTTFDVEPDVTYFLRLNMPVAGPVSVQLSEAPRQPPPDNDLQYRATAMSGTSWTVPVTLGAETEDRQWWKWTAPVAGVSEVTLEGTLAESDILRAWAPDFGAGTAGSIRTNGGPPVLRLASQAGTRWYIQSATSLRRLRPATLRLAASASGVPANDSWLTPQVLAPGWSSVSGDVTMASFQPGERDHSNSGGTGVATLNPVGRSVWYDWTPGASGPVTLRLDTTPDLAMRVYRGQTEQEWFEVEDVLPGERRLSFSAVAGQNYHIAVATRPPFETTAPFTLRFGGPANDLLTGAIVLSGASATSAVESAGAGTETGEPGYGFNFETPRASLWWKWTALSTGSVWLDTRGSEFDTVLTVFGTDPPDTTSRVAENDNLSARPGATASAVRFATTAGQTYIIRITRRDAVEPAGLAKLNLTTTAPPDPYPRWLAAFPTLAGANALETADPDGDGLVNLAELALGTSPIAPTSRRSLTPRATATGWEVETLLDRDALESIGEGTPLEVIWQSSRDLQTWQPASAAYIRRESALSLERLSLTRDDPPFVRLLIRRAR